MSLSQTWTNPYMGWSHILDMDTVASTSDDNLFGSPKAQASGKVLVQMPTDDSLCKKLSKSNLTLVKGYPFRSTEAHGLLKDQFI